ncbi:hypothetical protein [Embleya sp. MST-111070]|uniref:hypothetical protein n=1 Tax=Embleya sp. MST-111070 TaxID=3398231 RepID=UPI003F732B89
MSEQSGPSANEANPWTADASRGAAGAPTVPGSSVWWRRGFSPLGMRSGARTGAGSSAPDPKPRGFDPVVQPLVTPKSYREQLGQDGLAEPLERNLVGGGTGGPTRAAGPAREHVAPVR